MGDSFENLEIEISAQASKANAALDALVKRLQRVSTALMGANGPGLSNLANGVSQLSAAMQTMGGIKTTDFNRLAKGLSRLGTINASSIRSSSDALTHLVESLNGIGAVNFDAGSLLNLVNVISRLGGIKANQAATNLPKLGRDLIAFVQSLNGIGTIQFDISGLAALVGSISKLGGKSAVNAIPNIQNLGIALRGMMQTLSTAPRVSQNLIQMTNAMAALSSNGARVGSAVRGASTGLRSYGLAADRARKSSKSLASSMGLLYAKFWVFMRLFRGLWKSVESSMDYVETVNYFDSAMGQLADNAKETWKQAGFASAEAYADSFGKRSKELTKKMTGFNIGGDGVLTTTNMPNLGLNPEILLNYQATYAQMASSMGVASGTAIKLSNALTMIGADLASVKNLKFETVWENMASGMVGMSRAVDKYGINLRSANMQEELYRLGLNLKISKLNQADKAVLRTIMVLNASKYSWGDLARTLNSPANQLRMLQAGFSNLARTIGGLLLPIVAKVLPYINAMVVAIQRLFSWIGGLLGIKLGKLNTSVGSAAVDMSDFADNADNAASGLGDAAKNAKKLNKQIAGWHEVENMTSKDDSSGGGGAGGGAVGGGGLLDSALDNTLAEYSAAWDAAFAGMEYTVNDMADKVCASFKRIWDTAEPTREALKRLWNEGLSEFGSFTWTALKDFWDYFLVPLGNWTLGEGLPRFFDITNKFLTTINWSDINTALKNFWQALEPFAKNIGRGLLDFYEDLLGFGANFINQVVPDGINKLADALKKIDPETARKIGYGIGIVATGLIGLRGIKSIVTGVDKSAGALKAMFTILGPFKYVAIAAGIGGLVLALDKFGYIKVNWGTLSKAFGKLATALGKFAVGIGKGLISFIDGFLDVASPGLEVLINGLAGALDGLGTILSSIPESVISGITETISSFFVAFLTYKTVMTAGGLISSLTNNLGLLAEALPGIVNSGSILSDLASALGPAALGGIAFTVIAGGIMEISNAIREANEKAADNSSIGQFSEAIRQLNEEVSQKTSQIQTSLANIKHDIETAGVAETQAAKDLADQYERLSDKVNLSANDKARLKQISGELVEIIPGLNKYIDKENGFLKIQNDTLEALIKNQELYAKKQAAQSMLTDAYKQAYEAQNNATKAQDDYNSAVDEYLKKSGLTKKALEDIKNGTLDADKIKTGMGAPTLNGEVFSPEEYGFKSNQVGALRIAVEGLNEVEKEHKSVVEDADKAQADANETLKYAQDTLGNVNGEIDKNNSLVTDAIKNSADYQQALSDLKGEFSGLGIAVSEEFLDKLAIDDTGLADDVISMFKTLETQTEVSGEELAQMFDRLGFDIPKGFADALSNQSPEARTAFAKLFANLSAGVSADSPALMEAFEHLGYDLPETLIEALSSKDSDVQAKTIELLGMVEGGKKLAEKNLIEVFKNLGLDIPNALIESLSSDSVTAETQKKAIDLLGQLSVASDLERKPLIEEYNKLGVGIVDEGLIASLKSKKQEVNKAGADTLKETASGAITESSRTGNGTMTEAAQNAIDGYIVKLTSGETARKLLQTGISFAQNFVEGVKKGQESHSPSRATAKLGGYAVGGYVGKISSNETRSSLMGAGMQMAQRMLSGLQKGQNFAFLSKSMSAFAKNAIQGFNGGLSENMASSFKLANQWSDGFMEKFGFLNPEVSMKNIAEEFGKYKLNPMLTEGLNVDVKFDMAAVPKIGDLSSSISLEIQNAISDATYSAAVSILSEMKEAVKEGMSEADVTAVMDADNVFSNIQKKSREYKKRTSRPAFDY